MPPSIEDLNACCTYGYNFGVIACHNGSGFGYFSRQFVSQKLYEMCVERGIKDGLSEYDAQIAALKSLKRNYDIDFWEAEQMRYDFEHLNDFLDDNVVISDEVKAMSREQLRAEIARLEAEAAKEKARINAN